MPGDEHAFADVIEILMGVHSFTNLWRSSRDGVADQTSDLGSERGAIVRIVERVDEFRMIATGMISEIVEDETARPLSSRRNQVSASSESGLEPRRNIRTRSSRARSSTARLRRLAG